jgi:oligopeptide/dipeptide ABC transporter ATP-binding protein
MLQAEELVKVYRGRRGHAPVYALHGVSIEIQTGRTLGIVGESGCGKSTLARLLVGLEAPTSGTISIGEISDVAAAPPLQRARQIQLVFQDPYSSLDPRLTVEQALAEVLKVHGLADRNTQPTRIRDLLAMVALPNRFAGRYPHELSGGQAQRVAIARALAVEPRILVLDEPTSALDVSVRAEVMNLLVRLQNELRLTYLFVSHDLAMVRHISDEIAVMYLGRVVEDGPYQEVLDRPLHPYTQRLASAVPVVGGSLTTAHSQIAEAFRPEQSVEAEETAGPAGPAEAETGCPYRPRCPLAIDVCANVLPQLQELREAHYAACHVAAQAAGLPLVNAGGDDQL